MEINLGAAAIELVALPGGSFEMGSGNHFFGESPAHRVSIRPGVLIGRLPVTQEQWVAVMGENPSAFRGPPDLPVEGVSWGRAAEFCRRAGGLAGRPVRLPSEAEWEYACRAGTAADFYFGPWGPFADESQIPWEAREALTGHAWFDLNSDDVTHPVGALLPNPWGLHDVLGNVWEWCADDWHGDYAGAPADGRPWAEVEPRPRRCLRGGASNMNAFRCRSSYRSHDYSDLGTRRFGLRVVVDD